MVNFNKRSLALLASTALVSVVSSAAWADMAFTGLGSISTNSTAYAISGDGSTVVGAADVDEYTPFVWNATDGMVALDPISGGIGDCVGGANAVNFDGTVLVGYSYDGSKTVAARWIAGTPEALTNAYAAESEAFGISADGNVIVGHRDNGGTTEAFIWTTGSGTMATLTGVVGESHAAAVSSDGSFVGGSSDVGGTQNAMRWSSGGGLETLGTIGGFSGYSSTYALNADGSVATGFSASTDGNQAFRWVEGEGMTGLGALTVTSTSYGQAISADGNIITGQNIDGGVYAAFRWTPSDGMESLAAILNENGVDITGWELNNARGISADGKLITGTGTFGGHNTAYLMTTNGLISPEELLASLAASGASAEQARGIVNQFTGDLFFTARNILSNYFGKSVASLQGNRPLYAANETGSMNDASPAGVDHMRIAVYATGSMGFGANDDFSNQNLSGTTGFLFDVGNNLAFGVGVVGNRAKQDTQRGGDVRTNALGGSVMAAYEPASGLRLYGTAAAVVLDVDAKRQYLNGAVVDRSRGDTNGTGYAVGVRAGYEFSVSENIDLMPYGELEWSKIQLDAYSETGGGIPASYGDQDNDRFVARLGGEVSSSFGDDVTGRLRAAWGHRLSGDNGSVSVTALGLNQSIPSASSKENWAELGASMSYDVSADMTLSVAVDTRYAGSSDNDASLSVGLVYRLN